MPDTKTTGESTRSPLDGTELVRLATTGANWKAQLSAIFGSLGAPILPGDRPEDFIYSPVYYVRNTGATCTFSITSPGVVTTSAPHGLSAGDRVAFSIKRQWVNCTISIASPAVVTATGHGLAVNDPIKFISRTGSLPGGITPQTSIQKASDQTYYVIAAGFGANSFEFSTSVGGAAVNTSGSQSGQQAFYRAGHFPTGISEGQAYYVLAAGLTATQFEISATSGGSAINFTGTQEGYFLWQTGNDSTATRDDPTKPYMTLQAAVDYVSNSMMRSAAVIQLSEGTYGEEISLGNTSGSDAFGNIVVIKGNTLLPENYLILNTDPLGGCFNGLASSYWSLRGLSVENTAINQGSIGLISNTGVGCLINALEVNFGNAGSGAHVAAGQAGGTDANPVITLNGWCSIVGQATTAFATARKGGLFELSHNSTSADGAAGLTLCINPNYSSAFYVADYGGRILHRSGSCLVTNGSLYTGAQVNISSGSAIIGFDNGANCIPGTATSNSITNGWFIETSSAEVRSGKIALWDNTAAKRVTVAPSASLSANWTMTLPTSAGTNGYVLQTDGAGVTSWVVQSGSAGTLTVGTTTISGGTAKHVAYEDTGNKFNEAANFTIESGNPNVTAGNSYLYNATPVINTSGTSQSWFFGNSGRLAATASAVTGVGDTALQALTSGNNATAVGVDALFSLTTGGNNTAMGVLAAFRKTTGIDSCYYGVSSGQDIATSSSRNSFFGKDSGKGTVGSACSDNTAVGFQSLINITTGLNNVAMGSGSGSGITSGSGNFALGTSALLTGNASSCVAVGSSALSSSSGTGNIGLGDTSGADITSGGTNTCIGANTGRGITTGSNNTILGAGITGLATNLALTVLISDGAGTIVFGYRPTNTQAGKNSLLALTSGLRNAGYAHNSGLAVTSGNDNTLLGDAAGVAVTTGNFNTMVGSASGGGITTGSNNTIIGGQVGGLAAGTANAVILADGAGNYFFDNLGYTIAATLPAAGNKGRRAFVTDSAAAPAFMATLTGGGTTIAPVFDDGTNWRYG